MMHDHIMNVDRDNDASNDGPYEPLSTARHFRLLKLESGPPEQDYLSFRLETYRLGDSNAPAFTALSYTWGAAREPDVFDVAFEVDKAGLDEEDDEGKNLVFLNGYPMTVTTNLHDALVRFGQPDFRVLSIPKDENDDELEECPIGHLWVDALCICQTSVEERSACVPAMDLIYGAAERVLIWLGKDTTFLEDVCWLHNAQEMWEPAIALLDHENRANNETAAKILFQGGKLGTPLPTRAEMEQRWTSYSRFYTQQRYFQRAWVVQEVALARRIEVYCDSTYLDWSILSLFPFMLRQAGFAIALADADLRSVETPGIVAPKLLGEHLDRMRALKEDTADGDRERGAPDKLLEELHILTGSSEPEEFFYAYWEYLLTFIRQHDSTNPSDKIYAVFALLLRWIPSSLEAPIKVDYSQDAATVYTTVAGLIASKLPTLSILSLVEDVPFDSRQTPGLPSWVPDFAFTGPNPPTILELSVSHSEEILFQAGATTARKARSQSVDKALPLQGVRLDTVSIIGPVKEAELLTEFYHPTIIAWLHQTLKFARKMQQRKARYFTGDDILSALWKTLAAYIPSGSEKNERSADESFVAESFRYWLVWLLTIPIDFMSEWIEMATENFDLVARLAVGTENEFWLELQNMITRFGPAQISLFMSDQEEKSIQVGPGRRIPGVTVGEDEEGWQVTEDLEKVVLNEDYDMPERSKAEETCFELERERAVYVGWASVATERRLFGTGKNWMGIGPRRLQEGDEIWWLEGAAVPFILRKVSGDKYQLVGETYICGLAGADLVNESLVPRSKAVEIVLI